MTAFPLDDATLVMLAEACRINPDTGRTHLTDFLEGIIPSRERTRVRFSRMASRRDGGERS